MYNIFSCFLCVHACFLFLSGDKENKPAIEPTESIYKISGIPPLVSSLKGLLAKFLCEMNV
jgi:hypothetical protein